MKILLLGYGKEGQATEKYFKTSDQNTTIDILENFQSSELKQRDYSSYDIIFRSPSVPPIGLSNESSITKYFFDHCPCPIIGVTATKGKGTTCSFIKALLDAHQEDAYLVGNIGEPAINALDSLKPTSVVVYEMSSFQLWDLQKSPHVAVIGTIEPNHLNVHKDYAEYKNAKANICRYQTSDDYCIYYQDNPESVEISECSKLAQKIPYPFDLPDDVKQAIKLPGEHNVRNAIAAIAAVASFYHLTPDIYLKKYPEIIKKGLASFRGLPHRLEFVREIGYVKFYDDNFSTNPASTRVAIEAFPSQPVIPIIGGLDKTDYADLAEIMEILSAKNLPTIILMGQSGHELAKRYSDPRFTVVESLEAAVKKAYQAAKAAIEPQAAKAKPEAKAKAEAEAESAKAKSEAIVLMSPTAASFDMFKNVYDRGDQYQALVRQLS